MAIFYTWTTVSKETGNFFAINYGIFESKEKALEWAGFTDEQETEIGSCLYAPVGSICERLNNKYINYYLNIISVP